MHFNASSCKTHVEACSLRSLFFFADLRWQGPLSTSQPIGNFLGGKTKSHLWAISRTPRMNESASMALKAAQALTCVKPPHQRIDKCLITLFTLGLCGRRIGVWQRRIGGEPKAYEQSQRLVADFHASI